MTLLLCFLVGGGLASCSDKDDDNDPKEVANPIASVVAVDGSKTANAVISDADKTIKFAFEELTDLTSVSVTITMTKGALLKTPGKATSTVNLSAPYQVVVHNGMKEVTYTMTATPKETPQTVISAKVGTTDAVIDGQLITIDYKPEMEINAMTFDFTLLSGATVKSPADKTFNLELEDGKLVVSYQGEDYNYTVKVKDYVDPLLSKGWTDVTSAYGTLPNYIKVYKNENLLNNAATKSIGYIAIMSPGKSTMGALGAGKDNKKSIYTFASEEPSWNVLLVGIESTADPLIFRNGQFVQEGALYPFGTLGQDSKGAYKMAWSQKFDNKLYAFPYKQGTTYVERKKEEGTVWDAQTAASGLLMILWDGKIQTADEMICNTGINWNYPTDVNRYATSSVGLTAYGKVIAFCGQQINGSVGLTIPETAQVMKDTGCASAIVFERSSSPDMLINGQKTVDNSKGSVEASKKVQGAFAFK